MTDMTDVRPGPRAPIPVQDRLEAADLITRYTHLYDAGVVEGLGDLFTRDAVMETAPQPAVPVPGYPFPAHGREAIVAALAGFQEIFATVRRRHLADAPSLTPLERGPAALRRVVRGDPLRARRLDRDRRRRRLRGRAGPRHRRDVAHRPPRGPPRPPRPAGGALLLALAAPVQDLHELDHHREEPRRAPLEAGELQRQGEARARGRLGDQELLEPVLAVDAAEARLAGGRRTAAPGCWRSAAPR